MVGSNPSVSGGSFGEQEGAGILLEICDTWVQDDVEVSDGGDWPLLQGVQPRQQEASGVGARIRWGAKTDLGGDDRGPQVPRGEVILGWDLTVLDPVIEASGMGAEDGLDVAEAQVLGWLVHDREDLFLERPRLSGEHTS
jgi:hypothetical protein